MAFERAPIFKFNTLGDTGFDQVPVGSLVLIESTTKVYTKVREDGEAIVGDAINNGSATSGAANDPNIFNFLYYADEQDSTPENPNGTNSRVLGMDPVTMKLEKEIKITPYGHPGSCDRAAMSDKMYVRSATTKNEDGSAMSTTGGDRYLQVVDMVDAKAIKKIPFNWKPRSSGAYNRYRDMHAVTTKEFPWIHLIDCPTDIIVFSDGDDSPTYDNPQGNDGGNATGHAVWLDADHFALLDRMNVNIQVFNIKGAYPPYTVTKTQTIPTPSGCHSLRSFQSGLLLDDPVFFAAIEGAKDEAASGGVVDGPPEMWKMTFDPATGSLSTPETVVFNTLGCGVGDYYPDDNIHHFGCAYINGRKVIGVPLTRTNTVRFLDVDLWQLADGSNGSDDLMPIIGYYTVGNGEPAKAGHIDFCTAGGLQLAITTNHSGNTVSIIDLDDRSVTEVPIPSLQNGYVPGTGFTMSHANHVIGTKYYFFDAYYNEATGNKGTFHELDLTPMITGGTPIITRSTVTGGHPVQSFS